MSGKNSKLAITKTLTYIGQVGSSEIGGKYFTLPPSPKIARGRNLAICGRRLLSRETNLSCSTPLPYAR